MVEERTTGRTAMMRQQQHMSKQQRPEQQTLDQQKQQVEELLRQMNIDDSELHETLRDTTQAADMFDKYCAPVGMTSANYPDVSDLEALQLERLLTPVEPDS